MILQAGAKFKIAKMWQEAGDCYKRAAVIFRDNLKNRYVTLHPVILYRVVFLLSLYTYPKSSY